MLAAQLIAPRTFVFNQVATPRMQRGQALVRIMGCGICASSLPVWQGRDWFSYPLEPGAPGHEGWGTIEETSSNDSDLTVGDTVALLSQHAYAELDVVDLSKTVLLPKDMAEQGFPAEAFGCAMNIWERAAIKPHHKVAIVGMGFLGEILCELAAGHGAQVIAVSRRPSALKLAIEQGACFTIPLSDSDSVASQVSELTAGLFCDRVIETTGVQAGIDLASTLVRVRGSLIIAGYHQDGMRSVNLQEWNWKGIDVINAHERSSSKYIQGIRAAIKAVESGRIHPHRLLTTRRPLTELNQLFEALERRPEGFVKGVAFS
ncbi:MAG: zinc-binding dehydrogenase [Bdellovibrionales bacterium]|nr:zinc-binding dehydrogenase [Bdellovibrionales bacterium]